jgi:Ribonucleotide reductase, alpha subunit
MSILSPMLVSFSQYMIHWWGVQTQSWACWNREALLFKYGSGTGSNFCNIRGKGEPLSGGGTSSGLLSFLKIGDRAAGAIKSGGTTRRAAKMVTLDMDHPDIEEYIDWKPTEEEKVSAIVIGSTILQKHADSIMESIWSFDSDEWEVRSENEPWTQERYGQGHP